MANNTYDVLLRFISDQSAKAKTERDVDALNKKLGETEKQSKGISKGIDDWSKSLEEAERLSKKFGDEFVKRYEVAIQSGKSLEEAIAGVRAELEKTGKSQGGKDGVADQIKQARNEAVLLRRQVAAMGSDFEKVRLARIKAFGDRLGGASRTGLAIGGALVGGILAEANRFAKDAEDANRATQATKDWAKATEQLARARSRVDQALLKEALPLLQRAAEVANQAANFIEKNPVIIRAALETGKIVAGLSVLGILASKGITLYADAKALLLGSQELAAAKLQDLAADKQLIAARLQAGATGVDVPTAKAPGAGGIGGIIAAILAAGSIWTAIGRAASNFGAKQFGFESPEDFWKKMGESLGLIKDSADEASNSLNGTAGAIKGVASVASLGGDASTSSHRDEIVAAWERWQQEDAQIVQEAAQRRLEIVRDAEQRIAAATRQYANQIANINTNAARRAQEITEDFLRSQAEAEAAYQEQRAQLIRDAAEQIRDIEEAHQERVRKMTEEHNDRVADLTASRDALGLVKEQRRFEQEREEEERNTRREIAKRRQDLAERLAELDRQNEAEKAQRLAQFQEALAENEEQRQEQLRQAAEAFAEEQRQIQEQRAQQLRDLQESMNAERLRRREVFLEQIRDLDASLLGERNLRVQRYNEMLADADAFLAAYRAKLPTAQPPTGFASGGYASGIVSTGEMGAEYILTNRTTRAAEKLIGGRLTQDALLTALARGARNTRSLTINDQSRFDGRISAVQVHAIKRQVRNDIVREFFDA